MMSRKISKAILIAALLHLSAAQIEVEFPVDPDEFGSYESKGSTCNAQRGICDILCSHEVNLNICDSTTLQFDCKCASNNSAPGLQYYEGSIADYSCRITASNCMEDNVGNAPALANCTSIRNKCGFLDRMKFTAPPVVSSSFTLSTGDAKPTSGSTTSSNTVPTTSTAPGSSVAAPPINSTPTSLSDTDSDSDSESSSKSTLSTGEKAGIGAGAAIAGLLILGALGFFFYRAGKRSSAAAAAAAAGGDDSQKDSEKDAVTDGDAAVFGPELADTQRLEIGGREIPGELEGGAGGAKLESVVVPVEMGMSEREESEVRRVVGNK